MRVIRNAHLTSIFLMVRMRKNGSAAAPVALGVAGGIVALIAAGYAARGIESEIVFLPIGIGAVAGRRASPKTITIAVTPDRR
jgi:hypothetical protein